MADKTVRCIILNDYWDADGERQPAGKEVTVPVDEALDGVESGALSRVKDAKK